MGKILSDQDRNRLNRLVVDAETRTDSQIVLAVIQKCDNYDELPWKAFALGAAVSGLGVLVPDFPVYAWSSRSIVLIAAGAILAGGILAALLTVIWPGFAKCFLSVHRAETEMRQYADSLFLTRELFATRRRTGILLLVSLFERRVIILPDTGVKQRLTAEAMQDVIAAMKQLLRRSHLADALEAGLERLVHALEAGAGESGENELPDDIIEEEGV